MQALTVCRGVVVRPMLMMARFGVAMIVVVVVILVDLVDQPEMLQVHVG